MSAAVKPVSKVLPLILQGPERQAALTEMVGSIASEGSDLQLAALARSDPSLLLEDAQLYDLRLGSLLDAAVYFDQVETVRVGLEAGIHPDDPSPFKVVTGPKAKLIGGDRLLDWRAHGPYAIGMPSRRMLALALAHGADPDGDAAACDTGDSNSTVRYYLVDISGPRAPLSATRETLECVRMLLEAGARVLDPPPGAAHRKWNGFMYLLGRATQLADLPSLDSELVGAFRSLAALAISKGAAINYVASGSVLPQALALAKDGCYTMAAVLVELGAAESWKLGPGIEPESFFRGPGLGLYREALMRRSLQLAMGPATTGVAGAAIATANGPGAPEAPALPTRRRHSL